MRSNVSSVGSLLVSVYCTAGTPNGASPTCNNMFDNRKRSPVDTAHPLNTNRITYNIDPIETG